jgi:hypothetical protein
MKNKNLVMIVGGVLVSAACAFGGYQALKSSVPDMSDLKGFDKTLIEMKDTGKEAAEKMFDSLGQNIEQDYKALHENYK